MNPHKTILLAVVLLAITAPLALAQGTYTQIDVPGASYTGCGGVDTAGDIVGAYGDSNGNVYGFLLSGGTYTTIVYPGSTNTTLSGINDLGKIVGNSNASANGFLYDVQAQTFTAVTCPNAFETFPYAINNAGTIAGTIGYQGFFYGFELVGTRCSHIAPPGTDEVFVTTLTGSGGIVGNVANRVTRTTDFFLFDGNYKHLTIPNAPGAFVNGVDPARSALVGYYKPDANTTAGFLYQSKILTTLQFPGSTYTIASGINAAGEVVGTFVDASGNTHGFTWTTPTDVERK